MEEMLTTYVYINDELLDSYSQQLGLEDGQELQSIKSKASVSLSGPKLETERAYSLSKKPTATRIDHLVVRLGTKDLLTFDRPLKLGMMGTPEGVERPFGLEIVTATKVVFPKSKTSDLAGISEFAVWVAEPNPDDLTDEEWEYHGTFLVLPQIHFDDLGVQSIHSGCSALQALINGFEGKSLLLGADGEPLGRGSVEHPVEKLEKMGGIASLPQQIRVLYRMRYMTNEQCYVYNGITHRVNDLLAYPIFIATAS